MTWDGNSAIPTHLFSVCFDIHLHPKWDVFLEGYGYASLHSLPAFYMDTSIAFLINDHLQLDVYGAGNLVSISDYYQLSMGIAWKLPGRNKYKKNASKLS